MEFRVFLRSVLIDCHWSINETSAFCMIRQYFLNYLLIFWLLFGFHRWNVIIRPGCCHRRYGKSLRQVSPAGGSFRSRRLAFLRMIIFIRLPLKGGLLMRKDYRKDLAFCSSFCEPVPPWSMLSLHWSGWYGISQKNTNKKATAEPRCSCFFG